MFRECLVGRPYPQATRETKLSPSILTLHIPVMCRVHASFRGMLSRELPAKTLLSSICLSLHILSFSHTTLTIKSHIKYKVQKIEYNYNQIWHGIKANKTYSCKLQLYNYKYIADKLKKILVSIYL